MHGLYVVSCYQYSFEVLLEVYDTVAILLFCRCLYDESLTSGFYIMAPEFWKGSYELLPFFCAVWPC